MNMPAKNAENIRRLLFIVSSFIFAAPVRLHAGRPVRNSGPHGRAGKLAAQLLNWSPLISPLSSRKGLMNEYNLTRKV
jgi:hypothetical protein